MRAAGILAIALWKLAGQDLGARGRALDRSSATCGVHSSNQKRKRLRRPSKISTLYFIKMLLYYMTEGLHSYSTSLTVTHKEVGFNLLEHD